MYKVAEDWMLPSAPQQAVLPIFHSKNIFEFENEQLSYIKDI